MNTFDVVIAGAGPAGSMAAFAAARAGLEVLLVERDPVIGSPVRCAEGVDHPALVRFFDPDPRWIAATVSDYYLVAPDGSPVLMSRGNPGYILERLVFDRMVAEEAAGAGARVMTGIEVTGIGPFADGGRTVTLTSGESAWDVRARAVVAADGVESRVARWAGLATHVSVRDMETCAQVTCAGVNINAGAFSLYFTGEFAPGGYAWVFPKGPGTANIGLGISGSCAKDHLPLDYLDSFLARHFPAASVVSRLVGGVACSGGIRELTADGLLVAGDAAQMANPITGGGIINALIAGRAAGETIASALRKGGTNKRRLQPYAKTIDHEFGAMNRRFHRVKEGIFNIPDDRLNALAREILALPVEKRTPIRVLAAAVVHRPELLAILPRLVI